MKLLETGKDKNWYKSEPNKKADPVFGGCRVNRALAVFISEITYRIIQPPTFPCCRWCK